ncbi:type VI secretion system baseplate subunit TssF [Aliikangiella sp. G2MR2-5]|uniref:type VI secretion system baseplate subunit TssF n=1 Tax=Aliikangiella sp. G2MR2-5 TaxID=2788943 RepID=UPI0018AC4DEE|nr:type VI secretion system baseplate subunit TssF [Aliikangiella sp. G2MR2-5]
MADELLPYYEKELAYIRQLGAEFSKEHPKIASRLGINTDTIEDPHVSRLVESFAYLNARIQHKLDDDFPELTDSMLSVLYPHYQRPIPSMSIVQFEADREQLEASYCVPKNTLIETSPFQGETCKFSTCYDTEMLPLEVETAVLMGRPFTAPGADNVRGAGGVLKLCIKSFSPAIKISELGIDRLRFYLKGLPQHINPLYQMLLNETLEIVATANDEDSIISWLGSCSLKPVGLSDSEGLLPYPDSSFIGYRLLTEFFIFPEKFMFIDIEGLSEKLKNISGDKLELYIYVKSSDVELEHNVNEQTFALGCTPVVNLFQQLAEPITLDHKQTEYHLLADIRRPNGYEIYSVDKVTGSNSAGERQEYYPFYGLNHQQQNDQNTAFWFAQRRSAKLNNFARDEGTEVFLSLVDIGFNPHLPNDYTLSVRTTCSNRDLPNQLPFNNEQPRLQCVDSAPPCSRIRCLTQPTATTRPPLRNQARWRLISHLNLNYLSLTGSGDSTNALKEILRLYDFKESSVTQGLISAIISVSARPINAPITIDGRASMCRGIEIEIVLDGTLLTGSSGYLFALILEQFFAVYCSINSFTRLLVKLHGKEGYLRKCPPRAGEKILL